MRPLGFAGARPPPITYRSSAVTNPASSTITKPASIAVGDVVFVFGPNTETGAALTTASGSAWTRIQHLSSVYSYYMNVWWKVLTSTDVSNNWNISGLTGGPYQYLAAAYIGNGATTVTEKSYTLNPDGQSSLALTGYDPQRSRGTVTIIGDRDAGATHTAPSGFSNLQSQAINSFFKSSICDNGSYPGGTVTWALSVATTFEEVGFLLDIT